MKAEPNVQLSTNILTLEATVKTAQANTEQVVSFFFDMEEILDLTWRYSILVDITEARIENFLNSRSFKVKVSEILSDAKVLGEGTPQGRVIRSLRNVNNTIFSLDLVPCKQWWVR